MWMTPLLCNTSGNFFSNPELCPAACYCRIWYFGATLFPTKPIRKTCPLSNAFGMSLSTCPFLSLLQPDAEGSQQGREAGGGWGEYQGPWQFLCIPNLKSYCKD